MCCWSVKVTITVTGNLVLRVCAELTDAVCKLILAWWCSSKNHSHKTGDLLSCKSHNWYTNTDRKGAESLLKQRNYDGAFLIRPSSKYDNICTLSVSQNGQIFHINVRKRTDGWLALGTNKPNEQCFETIQDIIETYKRETLVINSDGEKYFTVLTEQATIVD